MGTKRVLIALPLLIGALLYFSWSELTWFTTQLTDTPEAYASYAESNPNGPHTEKALAYLDELEWRLTERYDGIEGYIHYLDRLPDGPHAEAAREGLRAARLELALERGTREAIDAHAEIYPDDLGDPRVLSLLERLEWRRVIQSDTRALYQEFLERFPEGKHAIEAQERLDRINYRAIIQGADVDSLREYLASDPPEEYREEAQLLLDEQVWEAVAEEPSVESVRAYLAADPREQHADDAHELLEELVWRAALEANTRAALEDYLLEFPEGIHGPLARIELEDLIWAQAVDSRTPQALDAYLAAYPEGSHVADIPRVQEEMLWSYAQETEELKYYEEYLKRFPKGPHSLAAESAVQGRSALQMQQLGQLKLSIQGARPALLDLQLELTRDPESLVLSSAVTLDFPPGTYFQSAQSQWADLVVVHPGRLRLEPNTKQDLRLNVAMVGGLRPGPADNYAEPPSENKEMGAILQRALSLKPSINELQLALFIAHNNLSYDQLSGYRGPSGKRPGNVAIAEAMDLCRKLGLEVSNQKIWKDRDKLRKDLPEGELRRWLSQPDTLGEAVRSGSAEYVKKLLKAGADPNRGEGKGSSARSPLAMAFEGDQLDLAKLLVQKGADPSLSEDGRQLLSKAVRQGRADWVKLLLDATEKPEFQGGLENELCVAVTLDNLQVVKLLLDAGAPVNGPSEVAVPLNLAAEAGKLEHVKELVARKAVLDLGIDSALVQAAAKGRRKVVSFLIEAGAEIDRPGRWGYTALHKSIELGQLNCAKELLRAGSDVNRVAGGFRPIDLASFRSRSLVEFLAEAGAEETIFSSVALGDVDGIERSLAKGESLERWGAEAQRPLHVAVRMRQLDPLERLLGHGAEVSARTTDGFQPLHLAVQVSWAPGIRALVEKGADLNDAGYGGTPFQLAVLAGDLKTAELLLELGADPAKKRAQDPSALQQARKGAKRDPETFEPLVKLISEALKG